MLDVDSQEAGPTIEGTITSSWPVDLPYVLVSLVWFDVDERPVFGIFELVADVASGEAVSLFVETPTLVDPSWTLAATATEHDVLEVPAPQPGDSIVLPST